MIKKHPDINMIHAAKWSTITEITAKLITPITNMILARILMPEAFGVIATISMIMSFVNMFTDAGFQKYLIQHEFINEKQKMEATNVAFWSNLLISFFLWIIIIIFCEPLAKLVGNPGLGIVIAVSCVQLPITSFSSIQMALYRREFDFKTLFLARLVGIFMPFLISIPLAFLGWNYWSLIIGNILSILSNAVILTIKSKWKPQLFYRFSILKEMLSFSIWTLIESVFIWLSAWIDSFLIGSTLSTYYVGVYKTSLNTVNSIISIITGSTTPILFSALSRLQKNEKEFNEFFYNMQKVTAYILFPLGIGIFLYSDVVTDILLGSNWSEASSIIGIWSLVNVVKIIFGDYCSEYYRAKGKPKLSTIVQLIFLVLFIPLCILNLKSGFQKLVYAVTLGRLIIVIIHIFIMRIVFNLKFIYSLKNVFTPLIISIIMAVIGLYLKNLNSGLLWDLCSILICILVYLITTFIFGKKDIVYFYDFVRYKKITT